MDIRPILLPQRETQTRKARELRQRGYSAADIAAAMGLRKSEVEGLLPAVAPHKKPGKARGKP